MIQPELLPDEMLFGYLGRVLSLNTVIQPRHLDHALGILLRISNSNAQRKKDDRSRGTSVLISISGLDASWVFSAHTMGPLRSPFSSSPDSETVRQYASEFFGDAATSGNFCFKCVSEDMDFHGFSYWRRSHQVTGRMTCPKHGSPLQFVGDANCMLRSPAYWSNSKIPRYFKEIKDVRHMRFLSRYLILCDSILQNGPIASKEEAEDAVEQRAKQMALARGGWHHFGKFLLDFVLETAEPNCLYSVIPESYKWRTRKIAYELMPNKYGKMYFNSDRLCLVLVAILFRNKSDFVSMIGLLNQTDSAVCGERPENVYSRNTLWSGVPEQLIRDFISDRLGDSEMETKFPDAASMHYTMEAFEPSGEPSRPYEQLGEMMRLRVQDDLTTEEVISRFEGVDRSTVNLFRRILSE